MVGLSRGLLVFERGWIRAGQTRRQRRARSGARTTGAGWRTAGVLSGARYRRIPNSTTGSATRGWPSRTGWRRWPRRARRCVPLVARSVPASLRFSLSPPRMRVTAPSLRSPRSSEFRRRWRSAGWAGAGAHQGGARAELDALHLAVSGSRLGNNVALHAQLTEADVILWSGSRTLRMARRRQVAVQAIEQLVGEITAATAHHLGRATPIALLSVPAAYRAIEHLFAMNEDDWRNASGFWRRRWMGRRRVVHPHWRPDPGDLSDRAPASPPTGRRARALDMIDRSLREDPYNSIVHAGRSRARAAIRGPTAQGRPTMRGSPSRAAPQPVRADGERLAPSLARSARKAHAEACRAAARPAGCPIRASGSCGAV